MLVVSRKVGEKIVIGNGIVLQLTAVKGGHVRLAVEAPKSVRILREELEPRPRPEGAPAAAKPVVVGPLKVSADPRSPLGARIAARSAVGTAAPALRPAAPSTGDADRAAPAAGYADRAAPAAGYAD